MEIAANPAPGGAGGWSGHIAQLGEHAQNVLERSATHFDTDDPDEASALMRAVYSRHRLRVLGASRQFRMRLQLGRVGALTLTTLGFGTEAELALEAQRDFMLVTTQFAGCVEIASGAGHVGGGSGLVAVDSTESEILKRFSADSRRLHVRIERGAIEALCAQVLGRSLRQPLVFQPSIDSGCAAYGHWLDALRLLLGYVRAPAAENPLLQRLEETVMLMLLTEHRHNYSELLRLRPPLPAPRHIRAAEDYMRANLRSPLTLSEIARAAGVSLRTLTQGFRQYRGTTPMHCVRDIRLDAVRLELQKASSRSSVAYVANSWGFGHLGRFAADYQRRFGERPSDTLKR